MKFITLMYIILFFCNWLLLIFVFCIDFHWFLMLLYDSYLFLMCLLIFMICIDFYYLLVIFIDFYRFLYIFIDFEIYIDFLDFMFFFLSFLDFQYLLIFKIFIVFFYNYVILNYAVAFYCVYCFLLIFDDIYWFLLILQFVKMLIFWCFSTKCFIHFFFDFCHIFFKKNQILKMFRFFEYFLKTWSKKNNIDRKNISGWFFIIFFFSTPHR